MMIICLANGCRTWSRTFDWKSEYTLYTKDLQTNPTNIKLLNNLGKIYEQENDHERAVDYYRRAIQIQPADSRGPLNLANLYSKLGNYHDAERYYRQAIRTMPNGLINLNEDGSKGSGISFFNNFKTKNYELRDRTDSIGDDRISDDISNRDSNRYNNRYINANKRSIDNINLNNDHLSKSMFNKNVVHQSKQTDTLDHMVSTMQLRAALNLANLLSNNPLKQFEANRLYEQLIAIKPDHGATYLSWIESILKSNSSDLRTIKHVLVQLLHNAEHLDIDVLYNVSNFCCFLLFFCCYFLFIFCFLNIST